MLSKIKWDILEERPIPSESQQDICFGKKFEKNEKQNLFEEHKIIYKRIQTKLHVTFNCLKVL